MRKKVIAVLGTLVICLFVGCDKADDSKTINTTDAFVEITNSVVEERVTAELETTTSVVEPVNVRPTYPLDGKSASEIVELLNYYTNNIEDGMTNDDIGSRFEYDYKHWEEIPPYDYSWECEGAVNGINFIDYYFYVSHHDSVVLDVKDYCSIRLYLTDFDIASSVYDTYVNTLKNLDTACFNTDERGTNAIGSLEWNFEVCTNNGVYGNHKGGEDNDYYEVHLEYMGDKYDYYILNMTIPLNVEF